MADLFQTWVSIEQGPAQAQPHEAELAEADQQLRMVIMIPTGQVHLTFRRADWSAMLADPSTKTRATMQLVQSHGGAQ